MSHRSRELLKSHRQARLILAKRLAASVGLAGLLTFSSLVAGMLGYHFLEKLSWIDAFASAAMILSGMGPLEPLRSTGGKLFAGLYALYSGLAVILVTGLILAPIVHFVLHRFHLETEND